MAIGQVALYPRKIDISLLFKSCEVFASEIVALERYWRFPCLNGIRLHTTRVDIPDPLVIFPGDREVLLEQMVHLYGLHQRVIF